MGALLMARIRTIKPDFWKHEELSELAPEVHMLAAALLNYADDEGYFRANPKLVKAECCPLREDSVSVHDALNQLSDIGYIRLFTGSDGKAYGCVCTFTEHQKINRPSPSKIRPLDVGSEASPTTHGTVSEPSPPEGNREQGTGKGMDVAVADARTRTHVAAEHAAEVADECRRLIGVDQAYAGYMDNGQVWRWLNDGAIPDRDVYPTIKRIMARKARPPNGFSYFTQAVADAKAANEQPMSEGKPDDSAGTNQASESGGRHRATRPANPLRAYAG
ncbi:MAG: hypothetical protein U5L06_00855 [Rhodovibrio sp.]|nr:hypothetical protein [Rhodovibrio sp.]